MSLECSIYVTHSMSNQRPRLASAVMNHSFVEFFIIQFASDLRCHPASRRRAIPMIACVAAQAQVAVVLRRQREPHRARLGRRLDLGSVRCASTWPRWTISKIAAEAAEADIVAWSGASVADSARWARGSRGSSSARGSCGCCGGSLPSMRVSTQ